MADTSTIASLATAGGTLVLAAATFSAFYLSPRLHAADEEPGLWTCVTILHWNLDRADPRHHETPESAEGPPTA
jgi:hypothetical protein